ncbi:hypothetical protein [Actinoplanes utahensis]|uniref:hypothetical protein n=1 Tax=Actinoplanes utahensis TaxID=1869 RepID=UPI001269C683|nr:hypothetical protein [Actinoplanes utahensis]
MKATKLGKSRLIAFGALLSVIVGLIAWALWPEPPRQREYLDATACLLTDETGVTAEPAKTVWHTMQEASAASLVRVQYLPVRGPQTTDNAAAYLASLTSSRCGAVIVAGKAQIDAAAANADKHPEVSFIAVGAATNTPGMRAIDPSSVDDLRESLDKQLAKLAEQA